jgi:tRNA-splicing ligase RtcB (3'-phosphate/5'-hydroxy nucleic acid ligase)
MNRNPGAPVVFGQHEENTLAQLRDVASRAEKAALMADGHLGYIMPIGGVAAYREQVSVVGVGFDIACGNAAIRTDRRIGEFDDRALFQIANEIENSLSFGVGRKNESRDAPIDHPLFASPAWEAVPAPFRRSLKAKARSQLGTIGSGNHYVDVFADENGYLWVGVHFGSRGFGHSVATGYLNLSQNTPWEGRAREAEVLLDLHEPLGHDYLALMELAGEYAYAGREWVARKVVEILGGAELELVHNHHNFAWREQHQGEEYVVVRKGATPAFPGQKGFIGGSMGDDAVIVRGTASDDVAVRQLQQGALFSTVHGAGRVMSRTVAAGKYRGRGAKRKLVRPGLVTPEMMRGWVREKGVILRGGGLDESPHAYRRLPEVLTAQGSTIEVVHTLRPLIVVMAGADEFDPYRD